MTVFVPEATEIRPCRESIQPRQDPADELVLDVVAVDAGHLHEDLNAAVDKAKEAAAAKRCGVLVIRHNEALFTVRTDRNVPFGQTVEHDGWHRHPSRRP